MTDRATGATGAAGLTAGLGRVSGRLIGRSPELRQLLAAATRVDEGGSDAVSIEGDAGYGKSRLLAELEIHLGALDWEIRRCDGLRDVESLATRTTRPLLLSADDADRLDDATLVELERIVTERPASVLVACTFGFTTRVAVARLRQRLAELATPLIRLRPLPDSDAYELATALLGRPPEGVERTLVESANGVPGRIAQLADRQPRTVAALPTPLTPLIGRAADLASLESLLGTERLVTLTGPGGAGKTRLAQELTRRVGGLFADGVLWVELAPRLDELSVVGAIADAAGVSDIGTEVLLDRTVRTLAARGTVVLVLDNAEHVLVATARTVARLLSDAPTVTILCTSREPLDLPSEVAWRVPTLSTPDPSESAVDIEALGSFEAVQLFVERAGRAQRGFRFNAGNAAAIAQICQRLDGLPLAIELVAARVRSMAPERIAAQLDDRVSVTSLARGATGANANGSAATDRHHSLQASIAWSEETLDPEERLVFRRLGVFVGGFTLDAATAVLASFGDLDAAVIPGLVSRLADRSLVVFDDTRDRFTMLETIRAFALERQAEHGELHRCATAHAGWFADWLEGLAERANGRDAQQFIDLTPAWLRAITPDAANCHAALDVEEPGSTTSLRIVAGMSYYWLLAAHFNEAVHHGMAAVVAGSADTIEWADAAGSLAGTIRTVDTELWASIVRKARTSTNPQVRDHHRLRGALVETRIDAVGPSAEECAMYRATRDRAEAVGDWYTYTNCVYILAGVLMEFGSLLPAEAMLGSFEMHRTVLVEAGCALWRGQLGSVERMVQSAVASVAADLANLATERYEASLLSIQNDILRCVPPNDLSYVKEVPGQNLGTFDELRDYVDALTPLAHGETGAALERLLAFVPSATSLYASYAELWIARLHLSHGDSARARSTAEKVLQDWSHLSAPGHESILSLVLSDCDRVAGIDGAIDHAHHSLALAADNELWIVAVDALEGIATLLHSGPRSEIAARLLGAAEAERERMEYVHRFEHRRQWWDHAHELAGATTSWSEGRAMSLASAIELAQRMRGERARPSTGWASLTPTERGVVDAVVAGLSNPEIATQLFMSRATVKTHLNHIYAKLGITTRAGLAAAAARRSAE